MAAYDFGAPKIDFSLLANLGNTFDKSRENQARFDQNAQRQKTLAELGGTGNMEALGMALMKAGDLEGGATALRLAEASKNRAADVSYRNSRAAAEDAARAEARRDARIGQRTWGVTGEDPEEGTPTYGWRDPYEAQPKTMPQIAVPAPAAPAPAADVPAPGAGERQFTIPSSGTTVAAPAVPAIPGASPGAIQPRAKRADPMEPDTVDFIRKPPLGHADVPEWRKQETKRVHDLQTGGEKPTSDMRNKLARARRTKEVITRELDALNDDVKEYGTEYLPGNVKARMSTTYTNLLMQLKEMYELGALQAYDLKIVQELLTDPTSAGWNPLEGAYKGLTQKSVTPAQVAKLKQIVTDGLRAAESSLGGTPGTVPEAADPRLEPRTTPGGFRYKAL